MLIREDLAQGTLFTGAAEQLGGVPVLTTPAPDLLSETVVLAEAVAALSTYSESIAEAIGVAESVVVSDPITGGWHATRHAVFRGITHGTAQAGVSVFGGS